VVERQQAKAVQPAGDDGEAAVGQRFDPLKRRHRSHLVEVFRPPRPDLAPAPDQYHAEVPPPPNQQPIAFFEDAQWRQPPRERPPGGEGRGWGGKIGTSPRRSAAPPPASDLSSSPSPPSRRCPVPGS